MTIGKAFEAAGEMVSGPVYTTTVEPYFYLASGKVYGEVHQVEGNLSLELHGLTGEQAARIMAALREPGPESL